jgi:hypothetical protein
MDLSHRTRHDRAYSAPCQSFYGEKMQKNPQKSYAHHIIALFFLLGTYTALLHGALAQEPPPSGMHHLNVNPTPAPPADQKQQDTAPQTDPQESTGIPSYKSLSIKDALVKEDDLEKWAYLNQAAAAYSEQDIKTLVHVIESDRGAVSPQGLFFAAKALSDHHHMDQAALYYFIGQLRLGFDIARWPPHTDEADLKQLNEDAKKTQDQSAPNRDRDPKVINPHAGIMRLSDSIGAPIIAWAIKDPQRLMTIINKVREWDESAPYAYAPGYEVGTSIPFERWGKALDKVRDNYFDKMSKLAKIMGRI